MCKITIDPGGIDVIKVIEKLFGERRLNSEGFITLAVTLDGLSQYECVVIEKTLEGQGHKLTIEG